MLKRLIIVILFLAIVFGGIFAWKYHQMQLQAAQSSKPPPPATIASAEAGTERWQPSLPAVGSLVAVHGIDVTTEVAGKVSEIRFESGQHVKAGEVLITLDDIVDRATLEGRKADRHLAEVQLRRAADLLPRRLVSQSEYDEAKANDDAAQAAVAEQEAIIGKKTIRAPFTGLLGIRRVDLGEYLPPGARIVSLQALDPIYVDYSLPERYFQQLAPDQKVQVRVDAYPDETFTGQVTALDANLDEGTRSIQIRATLPNSDGRLRSGMFAQVDTLQPVEQTVLTVPRTAISFNTYGDFVFLIEAGENGQLSVKRRQVVTGAVRAGRVEIKQGLEAGDRVVRAGLVKLRDGQPVQIDDSVALREGKVTQE